MCEPRWDEVFANNRVQIVPPGRRRLARVRQSHGHAVIQTSLLMDNGQGRLSEF